MTATLGADIIRASDGSGPVEFPDGIITGNLNGGDISGGIATDADVAASIATHNGIVASATQAGHVFELATAAEVQAGTDAQRVLTPLSIQDVLYDLGYGFDWYVDSINGNDNNIGTSRGYALKTIAALQAKGITANQKIGMARNSVWREQLTLTVDGVFIRAYGNANDARPIIDARNFIATGDWSKTGGQTNVYQCTATFDTGVGVSTTVRAFEDDAALVRVASVATCDSTPGSYYIGSHTVSPQTLYVHATSSNDPATNGSDYTYSSRTTCIAHYNNHHLTLQSLYLIGALSQNGMVATHRYANFDDCYFVSGETHNLRIGDGSTVTNCFIQNGDTVLSSAALLVINEDSPTGLGVTISDCTFRMTSTTTPSWSINTAIYGHNNVSGSYGAIQLTNCTFTNFVATGSFNNVLTTTFTDCTWVNCKFGVGVGSVSPGMVSVVGGTWTSNISNQRFVSLSAVGTLSLSGVTINQSETTDTGLIYIPNGTTIVVDSCNFVNSLASGLSNALWVQNASANVTFTNNVFSGTYNWAYEIYIAAAASGFTFVSDYNTFVPNKNFAWLDVAKSTLAAWQSASGQDAHST